MAEGPPRPAARAAAWLSLAAAPTFAAMAVVGAVSGGGEAEGLCLTGASPLAGMTAMYLLMSVFHAAPWLRLLPGRRRTVPGAAARRASQRVASGGQWPHLSHSATASRGEPAG